MVQHLPHQCQHATKKGEHCTVVDSDIELNIVKLYDSNIKAIYSINQISKKLNKAYPYINRKVGGMIDESILKKVVIGNSHLCSLNLRNEKTTLLLTMNEINKKKKIDSELRADIRECINEIKKKVMLQSVIYLPQPEEQAIFVLSSSKDEAYVERATKHLPIKRVFVNRNQLKKMIVDEKTGVFRHKILLYGYEKYFESLYEIEDTLRKVYSPIYS